MTEEKFIETLRRHIFMKHRTQSAAADHWSVSPQYVWGVLNIGKPPTEGMLKDLGVKRVVEKTIKYEVIK